MKKIVKVVALLSIVAAVMMGCKNPAGGNNNTPSDPPAPADWDGNVDLSTAEHNLVSWAQGWGESSNYITKSEGKVILTSGNGWANTIKIPLEQDLSAFTKVSVKASVSADWCAKNDDGSTKDASAIKLEIYSSDTAASELSKDYGDHSFLVLSATSAVTTINLSDVGTLYGADDDADLAAVKYIKINPQDGVGTLTIESIIFEK